MSSGRNVRFPSQHPGLSSTTTTSADEKFEALLNKYFRQLDLRCYVCVCVGIGRQFSSSFLLEKKKEAAIGIRLIDSECTMCIVMALAG